MWKFRSMKVNAEAQLDDLMMLNEKTGSVFKISCDLRIARAGKWLRKLSLDELPQFINVLGWKRVGRCKSMSRHFSRRGQSPHPSSSVRRARRLRDQGILASCGWQGFCRERACRHRLLASSCEVCGMRRRWGACGLHRPPLCSRACGAISGSREYLLRGSSISG